MIFALVLLVTAEPVAPDARTVALHKMFDELDCEKLVAAAPAVENDEALPKVERVDAAFRDAYCMVIVGNVAEATDKFAKIVHDDVDAKPAFEMEPRVQYLLDAARDAERKARADAGALAQKERFAKVKVNVRPPAEVEGGNRGVFWVDIDDPDKIVRSVRIDFKKAGEPEFYALPIKHDPRTGLWRGEIPGQYTRSLTDIVIDWYITVTNHDGVVIRRIGALDAPNQLKVLAGSAVASDLRANERVSQPLRYFTAIIVSPIISSIFAGAGFAIATFLDRSTGLSAAATFLYAILPPAGVILGETTTGLLILDPAVLTGPALTTAVFGVVYFFGDLAAVGPPVDPVTHLAAKTRNPFDNPKLLSRPDQAWIAYLGAAGGILSSAVMPAVFVALDAPTIEE